MVNSGYALAREQLIQTLTCWNSTTTSDGAADGSSLVDSTLIGKNDFLTGKSIIIMSGSAMYETKGIGSFSATTGRMTISGYCSAQIVAGTLYKVLNTLPDSVHISSGLIAMEGYDYVSGEYRKVAVNASGHLLTDVEVDVSSGLNVIVESGLFVSISGQYVYADVEVEVSSGLHVIVESGVYLASGIYVSISGQHVYVESGVYLASGTCVAAASGLGVLISGQYVEIDSGLGVSISGQWVFADVEVDVSSGLHVIVESGVGVLISGQMVDVASGIEVIVESGLGVSIASGLGVSISGQHVVSAANISGQSVFIGRYMPVAPTVGSGVAYIARVDSKGILLAAISGSYVEIDSGLGVLISGQIVDVASGIEVIVESGLGVTIASGLGVSISGQHVYVESGVHVVSLSGTVHVTVDNEPIVKVSGQTIDTYTPTAVRTRDILTPTALSGGTLLLSGDVISVTVKSLSGDVYVGGVTSPDLPFSGHGLLLAAGEAWSLDIDNFNKIRVCAPVNSGDMVSYAGVN